jgi:hypothetical protein
MFNPIPNDKARKWIFEEADLLCRNSKEHFVSLVSFVAIYDGASLNKHPNQPLFLPFFLPFSPSPCLPFPLLTPNSNSIPRARPNKPELQFHFIKQLRHPTNRNCSSTLFPNLTEPHPATKIPCSRNVLAKGATCG